MEKITEVKEMEFKQTKTNHDFYGNNHDPFAGGQPIDISDDDLPF